MWLFDPDYDGRSLLSQAGLIPIAGEGLGALARNLKAEIDSELIEKHIEEGSLVSLCARPAQAEWRSRSLMTEELRALR